MGLFEALRIAGETWEREVDGQVWRRGYFRAFRVGDRWHIDSVAPEFYVCTHGETPEDALAELRALAERIREL